LEQSWVGKFIQGSIIRPTIGQGVILVRGGLRAGGEEAVGQGLVGAGENLGVGGQQAALVGPPGGGQESVDCARMERNIQFGHEFDDAGALAGSLEDQPGIAFGAGCLSGAHDQFQEGIEDKQIALTQAFLETILSVEHFFQQVLLVAMQGRLAEVVLLAQLSQGGAPGQQGAIDGLALGVVTDGTRHGYFLLGIVVFLKKGLQRSAVSSQQKKTVARWIFTRHC
jgi:hypothetical protein